MDINEIKQTDIWTLYEQSIAFARMKGMYSDTDLNNRMYNGDQWQGLKIKGVEKVQYNFIKPIVKYKVGIVLSNLYAINYSSENFESKEFRKVATKICKLLNKKAAKIWEKNHMDTKFRLLVKDAAINDEGILYVYWDDELKQPTVELLKKNDVYYGDENNSDLESQPYILVKQRMSIALAKQIAKSYGVSDKELDYIVGDLENTEESGEDAKYEKDNKCTLVTKFYKENGKVYCAQATRCVDVRKDFDTGLKHYPIVHFLWEEKAGSARGEGEVRHLIPNQIETNKTAMRRILTVKQTAFPQKIANTDKITNEKAINEIGGVIKVKGGMTVDDVTKIFAHIPPAQMSPDVEKLQNELIQSTRELAGAGDIATGQINPESASGRAILAIQQAAQEPMTEHLQYAKTTVEELALVFLDMWSTYSDSLQLEDEVEDQNGEMSIELLEIPREVLERLEAEVKVDITPKGAFDKYAQEQSLENLLSAGYFTQQRIGELKVYVKLLDDDSVMPKQKILDAIEEFENEQRKIALMQAQAQAMQQRVNQFLMGDPQLQADQLAQAQAIQQQPMTAEQMEVSGNEEIMDDNPDDN